MASFIAYLLDPASATIRPVAIDQEDALESFYKIIGCRLVERLWLVDEKHVVYFDEEGMLNATTGLWTLRGGDSTPVAGRAIIVGDDGEGGDMAPTVSMKTLAERFKIFRPVVVPELVTLEPINPGELGGAVVHSTRLGSLRLQLESPEISVGVAR